MKRTKKLIILCSTLAGICVAIVAVKSVKQHIDSIASIDQVIYQCSSDNLSKIKWVYSDVTLEFVKDGSGKWTSSDDAAFPVDQDKISDFLKSYENIHASFIISNVEDYSQYGLDKPECVLYFTGDGAENTITIGDFSVMDSKRYISVGDGNVYLVDEDPLENIIFARDKFIQNDEIPAYEDITELKMSGAQSLDFVHDTANEYTYNDEDEYFLLDSAGKHYALSTYNVSSYLSNITDMQLTNFVTYTASKEDLAQYGLKNPEMTILLTGNVTNEDSLSTVQQTTTLYFGSVENPAEATDYDSENVISNYVRIGDSELVYKLDNTTYNMIKNGEYNSLRASQIIYCDESVIGSVTATISDEEYTIIHEIKEITDKYLWNDAEVSGSELVSQIMNIEVNTFASNGAIKNANGESVSLSYENRIEELALSVTLNNNICSKMEIEFYRYDGNSCIAVVDGKILGLVSRASVVETRELFYDIVLN